MKADQLVVLLAQVWALTLESAKEVLSGMGLHLGMDVEEWPPENIEDLAKKFEDQF